MKPEPLISPGRAPRVPPAVYPARSISAALLGRAALAGTIYCGVVFAAGFVLGAMRILVVAPAIGELAAVLVEMPFILGISVVVADRLIGLWRVGETVAERLTMGSAALALLLVVETGFAMVLTGQSLTRQLATYGQADKLVGLAGQIVFAALPALLLVVRRQPVGR